MGGTIGRIATGIGTGGLSEVARAVGGSSVNNFMNRVGDPLYTGVGGALLGAGALGGAGAGIGGQLGSLLGGGGQGGGGGGGLFDSALGGSLLGYGMSMDPSVQNVQFPNQQQDLNAISGEEDSLRKLFGQQNDQYGQLAQAQRDNLMRQLTTGPEGEAFREKYNNLGLLNSGTFNTGLANQFGNLAAQQQQDILGQNVQQTGQLANLDQSKLSRQFGLEDQQTQFSLAQALQNAQQKAQEQQALIGGGAYMMGQGGGGSGVGSAIGGVAGGIGNLLSSLLQKFRGGGVGSTGGATGNPNLDLYNGSNPYTAQPFGAMRGMSTF